MPPTAPQRDENWLYSCFYLDFLCALCVLCGKSFLFSGVHIACFFSFSLINLCVLCGEFSLSMFIPKQPVQRRRAQKALRRALFPDLVGREHDRLSDRQHRDRHSLDRRAQTPRIAHPLPRSYSPPGASAPPGYAPKSRSAARRSAPHPRPSPRRRSRFRSGSTTP